MPPPRSSRRALAHRPTAGSSRGSPRRRRDTICRRSRVPRRCSPRAAAARRAARCGRTRAARARPGTSRPGSDRTHAGRGRRLRGAAAVPPRPRRAPWPVIPPTTAPSPAPDPPRWRSTAAPQSGRVLRGRARARTRVARARRSVGARVRSASVVRSTMSARRESCRGRP